MTGSYVGGCKIWKRENELEFREVAHILYDNVGS